MAYSKFLDFLAPSGILPQSAVLQLGSVREKALLISSISGGRFLFVVRLHPRNVKGATTIEGGYVYQNGESFATPDNISRYRIYDWTSELLVAALHGLDYNSIRRVGYYTTTGGPNTNFYDHTHLIAAANMHNSYHR